MRGGAELNVLIGGFLRDTEAVQCVIPITARRQWRLPMYGRAGFDLLRLRVLTAI